MFQLMNTLVMVCTPHASRTRFSRIAISAMNTHVNVRSHCTPSSCLRTIPRPVYNLTQNRAGIVAAKGTSPREQFQREDSLVLRLWQCDKKNHGWREGRPLTVAAKFRSEDRPSPSR